MTTTVPVDTAARRLPPVVWVLAAGAFLMVTSELLVAGLLPQVGSGLNITLPQTGLLVTVFALGIAVGAPVMTILTLRLSRRTTLAMALLLFAVGQIVISVSDNYTIVLAARFLTAFVAGGFWAVAAVVATRLAHPSASAKALAVTYGGANLANVLGAPIAAWLGQLLGWRTAFAGVAVLVLGVAVLVLRLVPADQSQHQHTSIGHEFAALRSGRLWLVLLISAAVNGGMLAVYSFISPLLQGRTGLPESVVPIALALFGTGAVIGTVPRGPVQRPVPDRHRPGRHRHHLRLDGPPPVVVDHAGTDAALARPPRDQRLPRQPDAGSPSHPLRRRRTQPRHRHQHLRVQPRRHLDHRDRRRQLGRRRPHRTRHRRRQHLRSALYPARNSADPATARAPGRQHRSCPNARHTDSRRPAT